MAVEITTCDPFINGDIEKGDELDIYINLVASDGRMGTVDHTVNIAHVLAAHKECHLVDGDHYAAWEFLYSIKAEAKVGLVWGTIYCTCEMCDKQEKVTFRTTFDPDSVLTISK